MVKDHDSSSSSSGDGIGVLRKTRDNCHRKWTELAHRYEYLAERHARRFHDRMTIGDNQGLAPLDYRTDEAGDWVCEERRWL